MAQLTKDKRMLEYRLLKPYSNISHFVTTRGGGVSKGNYATFNCSPYSGDAKKDVQENQKILLESLHSGEPTLLIPYQTHDKEIAVIERDFNHYTEPEQRTFLNRIDALITSEPGFLLCVSTADCVPILLYDSHKHVIGAVHAGWRGTVKRILYHTVEKMKVCYGSEPQHILACIGPSISPKYFEVGDEVWQAFSEEGFDMPSLSFRNKETNKWHIDLWKANQVQLEQAGVVSGHIELSGICTYENHDRFFSARRLGIESGRILSGIMVNTY